jgi:putative transposase
MRTVKRSTLTLNANKRKTLDELCQAYTDEKRYWFQYFRAWDSQSHLGRPRTIRDEKVKQKYQSPYGLQARHWKLALEDAAETWDKYWQTIFVTVRLKISHRKDLSEVERHYVYWLLKNYPSFSSLMQGKQPAPSFPIEALSRKRIANYVRRIVRQIKRKPPTVKKARSIRFDANCYDLFTHKGCQYIKLMSLTPGQRIAIPLSGITAISGTITLILSEEGVDLHIPQELKKKSLPKTPLEAVDFGYTEVMTDTQGIRYGTRFGATLTQSTETRHQKMQKRHKLHALAKKKPLNPTRGKRLQKYNLGKKKHHSTTQSLSATLEKEINTAINQLVQTKNPSILVTEDLRHAFGYNKGKKTNRKLSSWLRGKLQDRIAFKALAEGFRHEQVNPAYGSQSCPHCEFVDQRNRIGDRFQCLHCGHEDISDRIAALNYGRRFGDPEIGRYTPYRQVKTILLDRFHRRLEMGQPMTVPGRTLETVLEVHPPSLSRRNVIAGREKFRKPGGQSESETKNKHVLTRF